MQDNSESRWPATHRHDPVRFFGAGRSNSDGNSERALLVLNTPIASVGLLDSLWSACSYKICADGGANRLHDLFGQDSESAQRYLPDLVHGDLDSLRDDVRTFYSGHGVPVTFDSDQYSTDFGKALGKIRQHTQDSRLQGRALPVDVVILGSLSGRVDQGLGLLSEIMRAQSTHQLQSPDTGDFNFHLVSECSITFLLPPGVNIIVFPKNTVQAKDPDVKAIFTPNVGILPLFGPASITIAGFEWDVEDWKTSMGDQVSTSNHIVAEELRVWTDVNVVFTVELNMEHFSTPSMGREIRENAAAISEDTQ